MAVLGTMRTVHGNQMNDIERKILAARYKFLQMKMRYIYIYKSQHNSKMIHECKIKISYMQD